MRLIYADALHDALKAKQKWIVKRENMVNEGYSYDQVHFAIDDAPTADAIPVEWIEKIIEDIGNDSPYRPAFEWLLITYKMERKED